MAVEAEVVSEAAAVSEEEGLGRETEGGGVTVDSSGSSDAPFSAILALLYNTIRSSGLTLW